MALTGKSSFLYGFEITANNRSIDFQITSGGVEKQATLTLGFYSLSSLMREIKRALEAADPSSTYTVSADRTYASGEENRVTISTSGLFLNLNFASGSRAISSVASIIGFSGDQTGSTSYTGISSAGIILVTELAGYTYLPNTMNKKVQGTVSVSAGGVKEALVWQIQEFISVEFQHEPEAKVIVEWEPLTDWMIQQKAFEFTPNIGSPNEILEVTLESSAGDGKGMGFMWKEMLPNFPFFYKTGIMKFRKVIISSAFI